MEKTKSEVTRLLCASAASIGHPFRKIILDHLKNRYRAVAPEVGLDANLLVQVCTFLEELAERRRKVDIQYIPWFVGAWIIAAISGVVTGSPTVFGLLLLLIVWTLQFLKDRAKHEFLDEEWLPHFDRDNFDLSRAKEEFKVELDGEIQAGLPQDDQNLVVYQGFSPFVGAGFGLGGWSFAINLKNPKKTATGEELPPIPFEISELYSAIEQAHQSLGFEGLILKDMFFVNGRDIRDNRIVLPTITDRPIQHLNADKAAQYIAASDEHIRHYKWIHVHYSGDQVVVSFFLRCSIRGNNLFCEINRFALTPLLDAYNEIDLKKREGDKGFWEFVVTTLRSLFSGLLSAIWVWMLLLDVITSPITDFFARQGKGRKVDDLKKEVKENPAYNYGASSSIRERCSNPRYTHYFQQSDKEMYIKIVDRTILDVIVDFVDGHNIDTSELKESRTTIMNSGVIVQGGDIEAGVLAVGMGAQAIQQTKSESAAKGAVEK